MVWGRTNRNAKEGQGRWLSEWSASFPSTKICVWICSTCLKKLWMTYLQTQVLEGWERWSPESCWPSREQQVPASARVCLTKRSWRRIEKTAYAPSGLHVHCKVEYTCTHTHTCIDKNISPVRVRAHTYTYAAPINRQQKCLMDRWEKTMHRSYKSIWI